jgi:hypothetical protein
VGQAGPVCGHDYAEDALQDTLCVSGGRGGECREMGQARPVRGLACALQDAGQARPVCGDDGGQAGPVCRHDYE